MWGHSFWAASMWDAEMWHPPSGYVPPVIPLRLYFRGRPRTTGAVQVGEKVYYIDE